MKLRDCPKQGIYFSIFLSLRGKEFQTLNSSPHLLHSSFFMPFFILQQKNKYYNSKVEALVCFPCTHLVEMKRVMYETMFTVPWLCGLLGWPTGECSGNSPRAMY